MNTFICIFARKFNRMKVNKIWKNKAGIYKITANNKCYVGSSKTLYERLAVHIAQLRRGVHHSKYMQRVFNKYGESIFNIEILEYVENNLTILREKEYFYIQELKPEFNSTTPVLYEHSEVMKEQISNTLKELYTNKENHPRYKKGTLYNIYDFTGKLIHKNCCASQCIKYANLSNRSVLNNARRRHEIYITKDNKYIILKNDLDLQSFLLKYYRALKSFKAIHLYKVSGNIIIKGTSMSKHRVLDKVLNSENFIYYSKKTKYYYTLTGLICRL